MTIDRTTELEIQVGCTDTLNRYALAVNQREVDTFISMFAKDGVWSRPGMVMHGHDEIRAYVGSRWSGVLRHRHCNGGAVIDPIDADNARVQSWTLVFDCDSEPVNGRMSLRAPSFIAEYSDHMRRIDGKWRIARRDTVVTFVADHALPIPGVHAK